MEKMNIEIREAKIEDIVTLKIFEQAVIAYERPFAPFLKRDPIQYYDLRELIERQDADIIVAVVGKEIVGSGYALIKNSKPFESPEQHAYLGFMYVVPNYRGKGINRKIIESLVSMAKSRNLTELRLDVYAENEIAINAYKKRGFKPNLLNMRLNTEK